MEAIQMFLPTIIISIPIMFICRSLAKEKGKNVTLWTILGLIPGINFYSLLYLFGTSSTILEGKIDTILAQMKMIQQITSTEKKNKEDAIKEVEGEEI
ncbi:hypothetical protein E3V08_02470 [Candidatus Atribacteria bacterium MT.SAG.1]|nr:hypothetical protein E3V08_02470 [Candidatus Atribacteria bacterium MT.SAG.1]